MKLKYSKEDQVGKKRKNKKRWTKQRIRSQYVNAICDLWAILVKDRDNYTCQFTGRSDKIVHAHHIVFKGTLKGKLAGYFDLDNGVTLSSYEHKEAHQGEPDAYIEKRDKYLVAKGMDYHKMKEKYFMRTKVTQSHLEQTYIAYNRMVEKTGKHEELVSKIHKRWISPMERAGVL